MLQDILIVVDMQNDFLDGILSTPEAREIVRPVSERAYQYHKGGKIIIYTQDQHEEATYLDSKEGQSLPIHAVKGTKGSRIHLSINRLNYLSDKITKVTKSGFGSLPLVELAEWFVGNAKFGLPKTPSFEIVGVCTDICVITNALLLRTAFPNSDIVVPRELTAGTTPAKKENALSVMESCMIEVRGAGDL